ncbi:MAG TPA: tRNA pseudouridine(55) synthase TruB [Chlamydiales bacterium]|nr:tRNA pseudouridine(55) synthase TruB [Chlamydiales bacterium]
MGILLIDKKQGSTSFRLVSLLRKRTGIKKIGHAGTLDPFATGVMVMLVGRDSTKQSNSLLNSDKQYLTTLHLGITTDSYDIDGKIVDTNPLIPTLEQIQSTLAHFQGEIMQTPPMFSAKKIQGQKLYDLARKGITVPRQPVPVRITVEFVSYTYPKLELFVDCSKGTYIRTLGHDIGQMLGCGAHLSTLTRTRSGNFKISECISEENILDPHFDLKEHYV